MTFMTRQPLRHTSSSAASPLSLALVGIAGALVASAIYNESAARRAERANPPRGRFIDVRGIRLHLLDTGGTGSPVVLLHGNGATSADMEVSGLLDHLRDEHRVLAFDRPGFGYSERPRHTSWTPEAQADLLAASLDRLGVRQAVVIGHSWGAMVATAFAQRHPQRVTKAILLSGYYFPTLRSDTFLGSPPAIPIIGDAMRETVSPLLGRAMAKQVVDKMFAPRQTPDRFWRHFPLELGFRPSQIRASAEETAMMVPAAARMRKHYASISVPVTIIAGSDDGICNANRQSKALHRAIRQSRLHIIPGFGHMVHYGASNVIAWAAEPDRKATQPPAGKAMELA